MSDFDKEDFVGAVYQMVKTVPYGRATSYGAIARAIGYPEYVADGRQSVGEVVRKWEFLLPGSEQSRNIIRQRCFRHADRNAGKTGRGRYPG